MALAAMAAMGRAHEGTSHFLSDVFTAYLFRPNNILTGRYDRKQRKERKKRKRDKQN